MVSSNLRMYFGQIQIPTKNIPFLRVCMRSRTNFLVRVPGGENLCESSPASSGIRTRVCKISGATLYPFSRQSPPPPQAFQPHKVDEPERRRRFPGRRSRSRRVVDDVDATFGFLVSMRHNRIRMSPCALLRSLIKNQRCVISA